MAIQQPAYRFEPSLCVFVGALGDLVYRDFQAFKDVVPAPLREGIGMILVGENLGAAQGMDWNGEPIAQGTLEEVALERTNAVTAITQMNSRTVHHYDNNRVQPTVFIIGHHDDMLIGDALKTMDRLERQGVLLPIIYLIETDEIQPVLSNTEPTADLSKCHAPDVAIFFQNQAALLQPHQQPQLTGYTNAAQRSYTIAEALFSLSVAGATEDPAFQNLFTYGATRRTMANVGMTQGLPQFAFGAAGASMLVFPRQAFLTYATYRKIRPSFNEENLPTPAIRYEGDDLDEEVNELTTYVRQSVTGTRNVHRIHLSARQRRRGVTFLRPDFQPLIDEDYTGKPHEDIASQLKDARERRNIHEGTLFEALTYQAVARNTNRQTSFATATLQANSEARQSLRQWSGERRKLWDAVATLLRLRVVRALEESWQEGESAGVRKGERLAFQLLDQLERTNVAFGKDKKEQKDRYDKEMTYFEGLVQHSDLLEAPIQNEPVSGDADRNRGVLVEPGGLNKRGGSDEREVFGQGRGMPPLEESIARKFALAIDLAYGQIPPLQMLAVVGLIAFVPLWVILSAVTPPVGPFAASWHQFVALALAALMLVGAIAYHLARRLRWRRLKRQSIEFHRVFFAHELEESEHLQRSIAINDLRRRIQRAHDRLDKFDAFREELRAESERRRADSNHNLFHSAAAARDIFYANGNLLSEDAEYTLETFASEIDIEIDTEIDVTGEDQWLNDQRAVFERLLEYVHKNNDYLVDAELDDIFRLVRGLLEPPIDAHVRPEHADVHYLLRTDLQRGAPEVLARLDALATVLADNPLQPDVWQYVLASNADHELVQTHGEWLPADVWTPTQSSSWFAKLRFATLVGNLVLPAESIAKLFPAYE
ncbi:MAG TPA: hypothetical protein VGF38_08205 [Ktedonobacterales bacterium]